jgi:hypothetical protein
VVEVAVERHAAKDHRDMVHHLDGRVRGEATAEHKERHERGVKEGVEVWIEEHVTLDGAERGANAPCDINGHVVHGQVEKDLQDKESSRCFASCT